MPSSQAGTSCSGKRSKEQTGHVPLGISITLIGISHPHPILLLTVHTKEVISWAWRLEYSRSNNNISLCEPPVWALEKDILEGLLFVSADVSLKSSSFCFCNFSQMKLEASRALGYTKAIEQHCLSCGQNWIGGGGRMLILIAEYKMSYFQVSLKRVSVFTSGPWHHGDLAHRDSAIEEPGLQTGSRFP